MARVQVIRSDTFEEWRQKSNQVNATVGDNGALESFTSLIYTGIIGQNPSNFTGTPAVFSITKTSAGYSLFVNTPGDGYSVDDTIIVPGSQIGGIDGIHDATINVDTINVDTEITAASVSGTPNYELVAELNQVRTELGNSVSDPLTTTAQNIYAAVNELDAFQGNTLLSTTQQTISAAINELDAFQGNAILSTTQQTISAAINEHESDLGTMVFSAQGTSTNQNVTYVNIDDDVTSALNALKAKSDFHSDEIGGSMATNYDGDDTNVISALNNLFAASSVSTLNDLYLRRDGVGEMLGTIDVRQHGLKSGDNSFVIKTGSSDGTRLTINTTGNIGIGKAPSTYKVDVSGTLNATKLRYNGEDTDERYLQAGTSDTGSQNVSVNSEFVSELKASGTLVVGTDTVYDSDPTTGYTFTEWSQDLVGAMFTGNTESGGISATYDDITSKVTLAIADDGHNHIASNIDNFAEEVQDVVGAMVSTNTESGIAVTYNDTDGKLNFDVNNPVLTFTGGATGTGTITNLGDTSITLTLDRDSVQDLVGQMLQGNTETGITVDYDDANNEIDFALTADPTINLTGDASGSVTLTNLATQTFNLEVTVADNSHSHEFANISDGVSAVQGIVQDMVDPTNIESGITVNYNEDGTKLNFDVNDPTFTFSGGDVTGSFTMTNLASVSDIELTVTDNSHNHTTSNITGFTEAVQDVVGALIGTTTGITITYDDANNALNFAVDTLTEVNTADIADNAVTLAKMADDSVGSAELRNVKSLSIKNSAGTVLKTIYGAGT